MKRLITTALIALPLFATAALSAAQTDTGVIKSINHSKGTLELADGKIFFVPMSVKLSALKQNEKVTIHYTLANGKMLASSVTTAK